MNVGTYTEVEREKIHANGFNANVMTDQEEERLGESMDRYSQLQTLLLYQEPDGSYLIIDGEHRWKRAQPFEKMRSIVLTDQDLAVIQSKLKAKGIDVQTKEDIFKNLMISMNRLRGSFSPVKLGEVIDSIQMSSDQKSMFLQMDPQEMSFYSLVQEVEEEKQKIIEKILSEDKADTVSWKVKDITGLKVVSLDLVNKKFLVDGQECELEDMTMTVDKKMKATLRVRYKEKQSQDVATATQP